MTASPAAPEWRTRYKHRLLGICDRPGPTILVVAGLHGNEISGLDAALRVFSHLERMKIQPRGRVVAVIGNLAAFNHRVRYVEEDLNRIWVPERVVAVDPSTTSEAAEMAELLGLFDVLEATRTDPITLLDLHTTSSASPPFVALAGEDRARGLLSHIGAVEVRGITRFLRGMLVNHAIHRGWTGLAFEAGAHRNIDSIDIHEALIWQALVAGGLVDEKDLPAAVSFRQRALDPPEPAIAPTVEIIHHHPIQPTDRFRMRPGYTNFQPVRAGDVLAEDRSGPIRAPEDGRIFLPLYQAEGRDGFFLVRDLPQPVEVSRPTVSGGGAAR